MRLDDIPNKLPGETVKIFLRRHWIDLLRIVLFTMFLLAIPISIYVFLSSTQNSMLSNPIWGPIVALAASVYLLVVFILTITEFTDYWLDVWVVTSERIINSEQQGLFNRAVSELHLDQIQDITSETKGFLATFLTYGDVYVQTAAEKIRFHFKNIDNPDQVKQIIGALIKECETQHVHSRTKPQVNNE